MEEKNNIRFGDPDLDLDFDSLGRRGEGSRGFPLKERFIWLKDDVWEDLDWSEDTPQDFMDKILEKEVFDKDDMPPPFHGDVIAGRDKNEKIIVFKLLLVQSKRRFGQQENDW